jgi:citrate lyase subunit beta/citryl-CoA lyase
MEAAPRTYLFVPGNRPERFDKALASGADAIILDLEDAVAAERKSAARDLVCAWLAKPRARERPVLVRINDASTRWFDDDLAALARVPAGGVMLPKAEDAAVIARLVEQLPAQTPIVALIESARGVASAREIARAPGVQRLAFGTLDYALDLDLPDDERGLIHPASVLAIESRCAGLPSPIAGVTPAIDDEARLAADWAFARATGYGAKMCIHPKQVAILQQLMRPEPAELEWAQRVVEASRNSSGAAQVDGRMVDRPVLQKALALLARAR